MIHQALCSPIPDHSIAVCLVSDSAAAMISNTGQCFLLAEEPAMIDGMVRNASGLKRVIVRNERATSTTVDNLAPHVLSHVIECMFEIEALANAGDRVQAPTAKFILVNPDSPSPVARQMMQAVHAVERFARMLTHAPAPTALTFQEPSWAIDLGVSKAPRAAREALIQAIGLFGQQVNNPALVAQAESTIDHLRTCDANIGRKP